MQVEYPQNAIALNFVFNDAVAKGHHSIVEAVMDWAKRRARDVSNEVTSTMLRVTLRTLFASVLGKERVGSFLAEHWAQHATLLHSFHLYSGTFTRLQCTIATCIA